MKTREEVLLRDKWGEQGCFERILSLISHDKNYDAHAKFELIKFMRDVELMVEFEY